MRKLQAETGLTRQCLFKYLKTVVVTACLLLTLLAAPLHSKAYSVLTHEALIDANWKNILLPYLKHKYPKATDEELEKSRAFAYGGAVSPDMGYYPFGSALFTNLVHYVRSGDFVQAVLDEADNLNEQAFALGVLCHYMADTYGHPLGTNRSVPIVYPEIGKKYGEVVTYAEDKTSHLRMEFGFDVLQTARGNYASQAYHNFIGFQVADSLLNRAFMKTYGLDMKDIFPHLGLAISTFRWSVKELFPTITKAAWSIKKSEIKEKQPGTTGRKFKYRMHNKQYHEEFGKARRKPGFTAAVMAWLIRVLPKVGPLKALKFKTPGPQAEKLFIESFDTVSAHYALYIKEKIGTSHHLPDIDFDTGKKTALGEYPLCDEAYNELLLRLKKKDFATANMALRQNIIGFYKEKTDSSTEDKNAKEVQEALTELKTIGMNSLAPGLK
jgi:hypothetical protein